MIKPSIILDGRGYALVPLPDLAEATRLHAAGVTIRLEGPDTEGFGAPDSCHIDRYESLSDAYPWYAEFWSSEPRLFAVLKAPLTVVQKTYTKR